MQQYIMGMITGASLIACAFMFMGQASLRENLEEQYKKQNKSLEQSTKILEMAAEKAIKKEKKILSGMEIGTYQGFASDNNVYLVNTMNATLFQRSNKKWEMMDK